MSNIINKVVYDGNVLIDLTDLDVTAGDVVSGVTFIMADGTKAVGTITIPTKISDLNDDVGLVTHDNSGNVTLTGNITVESHGSPVGWYDAHISTSSLSSGTSFVKITGSDISLSVGRYILTGSARFAGNATGYRGITIQDSNGSITRANATQQTIPSASWSTSLTTTIFYNATSSTTVSLMAYQNSGSSLSTDWAFYAIRIR